MADNSRKRTATDMLGDWGESSPPLCSSSRGHCSPRRQPSPARHMVDLNTPGTPLPDEADHSDFNLSFIPSPRPARPGSSPNSPISISSTSASPPGGSRRSPISIRSDSSGSLPSVRGRSPSPGSPSPHSVSHSPPPHGRSPSASPPSGTRAAATGKAASSSHRPNISPIYPDVPITYLHYSSPQAPSSPRLSPSRHGESPRLPRPRSSSPVTSPYFPPPPPPHHHHHPASRRSITSHQRKTRSPSPRSPFSSPGSSSSGYARSPSPARVRHAIRPMTIPIPISNTRSPSATYRLSSPLGSNLSYGSYPSSPASSTYAGSHRSSSPRSSSMMTGTPSPTSNAGGFRSASSNSYGQPFYGDVSSYHSPKHTLSPNWSTTGPSRGSPRTLRYGTLSTPSLYSPTHPSIYSPTNARYMRSPKSRTSFSLGDHQGSISSSPSKRHFEVTVKRTKFNRPLSGFELRANMEQLLVDGEVKVCCGLCKYLPPNKSCTNSPNCPYR